MMAMERLVVAAAFLCSAAAARRALHEPLYPIQWTPPPPPQQFVDPPPVVSSVLFPSTPSPPAASASKNVVTAAVSASVAALFLLLFLALFLYWKRHSSSPDCRSFIGSHDGGERGEGRNPAADFLYLGIMDAGRRRSGDVNASPYRKLAKERAVEMHHPSPQLQPMPPLSATASRRGMAPPLVECYDGDGFRTPQRSATSASVSPCSWVSRMSLPSISSGGTEFLAATSLDPAGCRRFSCSMQLGNFSFSQVKQMIRPITLQPPPSPLPHPPPPPPPSGMEVVGKNEQHINDSMAPSAPSSERLSNPEPRESIRIGTSFPPGKNSNGIVSSDSRYDEKAAQEFENDDKPKLKPPHWHKPKASSNQAMAWDQLKSSSFEFNEDAIETLIVNNAASTLPKETSRIQGITFKQENIVLDLKKSQNITILLKALNVTREEVSEALQEGIPERLGSELLKALVQMAPTKEEEIKLRDYMGDLSKLGLAERFLKAVLDIPHAFKRVDAMLYRANFESEIKYLLKSFETLKAACEDLRTSRLFLELLEAVQRTESRINVGTHRGQAQVFKLDSLLKLADVIGTDGRTTLLHFVLQDIVRSERSSTEPTAENPSEEQFERECLEVVARLSNELDNVKKAAAMDLDVLISYVSKLEVGLQKIKSLLQLEKSCTHGVKFFEMMRIFHGEAEREIDRIKTKEKSVINLVKETTTYFHGDAANEDAHSLRIFVVVSGFLSVLDKERKEEGNLHERAEI